MSIHTGRSNAAQNHAKKKNTDQQSYKQEMRLPVTDLTYRLKKKKQQTYLDLMKSKENATKTNAYAQIWKRGEEETERNEA